MAVYYTLKHKSHHCPVWGIDLMITAKYHFFDQNNPHIGTFSCCTCPIVENLKLPQHKQKKEYVLYRFCRMEKECLHSIEFEPIVDFQNNGFV